jgi:hypothetical protein
MRAMVYPCDCVDRLLAAMESNDSEDPPDSKYAEQNDGARALYWPHPEREQLELILDVAHAASLQPEEGRLPQFALAFVSPQGAGKNFDVCAFESPRKFDTREIAKLVPAADPGRTFVGLWSPGHGMELSIWGLIHSRRGPLSTAPAGGNSPFLWPGSFFAVRVRAPGVLLVYHAQRLHLLYVRGEPHWGLSVGRLQAVLRDRAHLDPDCAEEICQIVARMVLLAHGGTILITDPDGNPTPGSVEVSYAFKGASPILKDAVQERRARDEHKDTEGRVRNALDFVAQLTQVDGAVHMTSDLAIRGFGAKIAVVDSHRLRLLSEAANPTHDAKEGPTRELSLSEIPGMRHRSAALFCAQQTGQALAIVVSQDGDVTLVGRQDDGVVRNIGPFALGVGVGVA